MERPISLLVLSEDPTLPHVLWNALVSILGEAEAMKRYELPRFRTASGRYLLQALKQDTLRADVVLIDVRARKGLDELTEQRYEGFVRLQVWREREGQSFEEVLLRPPAVALVPNYPNLVQVNTSQEFLIQPQWRQYFSDCGYAGVLVFPEEHERLHQVVQEVRVQPFTPRPPLPPATPNTPQRPHQTHPSPPEEPPAFATRRAPSGISPTLEDADSSPGLLEDTPVARPRLEGVVAIWSPLDYVGRTTAALELAVGLQLAGYPTLLGEFRRPYGFLAQKLTLDEASFACSLLTLAGQVNDQFIHGGPFVLPREAVRSSLLRGLPLYDLRHQTDGPRLEFFHTGFTSRQEAFYELEVLQDPRQAMLRQLIEMIKEPFSFTLLVVGSASLDPVHYAPLAKCDRLLICLPLDPSLFGVAVASIQLLLRHCPKSAANIDICFTRWTQVVQKDMLPDVARACYDTGQLEEQQLRKFLQALNVEREVEGFLKACGLSTIAAFLPDERSLTRRLGRKSPVAPALLQAEFAQDPYVLAIKRQLLPNYITLPPVPHPNERSKGKWGRSHEGRKNDDAR
jgi:hypothetical protein